MCIAHECAPYGHLAVNGNPMKPEQLARLVGLSGQECADLLAELEQSGVFSKTATGCIFSRRMVKDEALRTVRAECGRLGGNPNLVKKKVNQKDKQGDNQADKQTPTPSSSSSSSKNLKPLAPVGAFERFWEAYPRKKSKGQAEKAWAKLHPNEQLAERILASVERAKTSADWLREGGQFVPYPATWLNAKGWEDELPESSGLIRVDA